MSMEGPEREGKKGLDAAFNTFFFTRIQAYKMLGLIRKATLTMEKTTTLVRHKRWI
jgi:hypothetical protein